MQKENIEKLALENVNPCVTISLNTHRTLQNGRAFFTENDDLIELGNIVLKVRY